MPETDTLVLELWRQENTLGMSIFEQDETAQTLRYYSQCQVSFPEIARLCQEITGLLNAASKKNQPHPAFPEQLKKSGQFLWDHLLARKVRGKLLSASNLNLILLLEESLISIPWELLYDGRDFLCLKFNIGRLLRTKHEQQSPARYRGSTSMLRMLVLANPTADLPSAYKEGLYIRNKLDRLRNQVQVDFKSTAIGTLYLKKNLRDYDIVHFAGHCEYDSNDHNNSGWLLNDGRFTAQDIAALGEAEALPSIIFSNGCYSARVEPGLEQADYQESTYNLASAFLYSGVRHYIGTVWHQEDESSLAFAQAFYGYLTKGKAVGESLRLARLKLVKEYGLAHLSWAGYLLYGNPALVLFKSVFPRKVKEGTAVKRASAVRRMLIRASAAAAIFILLFSLYLWLPSINPGSYIAFSRSEKLFQSGRNSDCLVLASGIIKKDPMFLAAYPLAADAYWRLGREKEALRYYFDYVLYSQKRNDKKALASAYLKIGWLYQAQADYQKAFVFYQKALSLSTSQKDKLGEGVALRRQAVWYIDQRQDDKALELLIKSSEINRERSGLAAHRYNLACDYFDIGLVFVNKDDLPAARKFYRKSFDIFQQLKLKHELSDYYFNLGEIHLFNKEYQKALEYYRQGLAIDEAQGNIPSLASDYIMLGELYLEMDNLKDAEPAFDKTILLCQNTKLPQEEASASYNLGRLYVKKRQKNKAREFFRKAQEIYYSIDPYSYQQIKEELLKLDNPH